MNLSKLSKDDSILDFDGIFFCYNTNKGIRVSLCYNTNKGMTYRTELSFYKSYVLKYLSNIKICYFHF